MEGKSLSQEALDNEDLLQLLSETLTVLYHDQDLLIFPNLPSAYPCWRLSTVQNILLQWVKMNDRQLVYRHTCLLLGAKHLLLGASTRE